MSEDAEVGCNIEERNTDEEAVSSVEEGAF
jgi:hypothetical protein